MVEPFCLVVTGPSGSGKSTLIRRLLDGCPWLRKTVSATTRKPRPGEADGRDYHFLSRERFEACLREGKFLEHEVYAGSFYGTLIEELDRPHAAAAGAGRAQGVLLDLDIRGARTVKQKVPGRTTVVFVRPPSLDALEARLKGRSTESPEKLAERLAIAREVLEEADREERLPAGERKLLDRFVVNDDLESAARRLKEIAEELRGRFSLDGPGGRP